MFTLVAMLGGMVKSATLTAGRTILFRLLVMCVILVLIHSSIVLIIGPTMTASSEMLRSMATALASVSVALIPLKIGLTNIGVLSTILLWCASLIAIILKLMLTILRSLASILWCKPSKLLVSALTTIRSVASTLTWGIVIVTIRVFVCVSFFCLLGFWWVLSLFLRFSFRFSSTSGLFWFCTFK